MKKYVILMACVIGVILCGCGNTDPQAVVESVPQTMQRETETVQTDISTEQTQAASETENIPELSEVPETGEITDGSLYETNDYIYCYNGYIALGMGGEQWIIDPEQNGWGVRGKNEGRTEYEPILEEIQGIPVTNMTSTFELCRSLQVAPEIPESVTNLKSAFAQCESLVSYAGAAETCAPGDLSGYILPEGITQLDGTFWGCSSLTQVPPIPARVTSLENTYKKCSALVSAPEIPEYVVWMNGTFSDCSSLTGDVVIHIPKAADDMTFVFYDCFTGIEQPLNLVGDGEMLDSVKNMYADSQETGWITVNGK